MDPDGREDDEPIILKSWKPETPKKQKHLLKALCFQKS